MDDSIDSVNSGAKRHHKKRATMSSGFGLRGGIGRCYPFWAEYKECLVRISSCDCGVRWRKLGRRINRQ